MITRRSTIILVGGTVTFGGCTTLKAGIESSEIPDEIDELQFSEIEGGTERWKEQLDEDDSPPYNAAMIMEARESERAVLEVHGVTDGGDPNCYEFDLASIEAGSAELSAQINLVDISDGGDCTNAVRPRNYRLQVKFEENIRLPEVVAISHGHEYTAELEVR